MNVLQPGAGHQYTRLYMQESQSAAIPFAPVDVDRAERQQLLDTPSVKNQLAT